MTEEQHRDALHTALARICIHETLKDYERRNKAVIAALFHAQAYGYAAGIRFDDDEPEYPVVFIELNTGQVSWHITQHVEAWDGHDTEEKYKRLHAYIKEYIA